MMFIILRDVTYKYQEEYRYEKRKKEEKINNDGGYCEELKLTCKYFVPENNL